MRFCAMNCFFLLGSIVTFVSPVVLNLLVRHEIYYAS